LIGAHATYALLRTLLAAAGHRFIRRNQDFSTHLPDFYGLAIFMLQSQHIYVVMTTWRDRP